MHHEWIADSTGRLDVFLVRQEPSISRVKAGSLVKEGMVMVNGRIARKPALVLTDGDVVQLSATGEPVTETRLKAIDLALEVIYEDDACFVLNKPAKTAVHPGAGLPADEPTVLHGVAWLFKQRKIPFSSGAVLVHRLDKDTTGCLLVAKTPAAHKALQMQFETRTVKKEYVALVAGVPKTAHASIDASIGRSTMDRTKMTIMGSSKMREAKTTYRTLAASDEAALLVCELHTGRTHQIRVHLHAIGHPILGDVTYANTASEKLTEKLGITSICLHAWKIAFVSPADAAEHAVEAPLPSWLLKDARDLGISMEG